MGVMRQTAVSETYSHLVHLERTRRVTRSSGASVDRWHPTASVDPASAGATAIDRLDLGRPWCHGAR